MKQSSYKHTEGQLKEDSTSVGTGIECNLL